jgi:hypothetical protein
VSASRPGRHGEPRATGLTTPDPVTLHAALRRFADQGFAACAIEASSIGIVEQRLAGARIAVALFTNFTRDHLDYHGSMDAYWAAKRALFAWPGPARRGGQRRRPQGAALAAELRRRARSTCGPCPCAARRGCRRARAALRRRRPGLRRCRRRATRAGAQRADRRLQRQQPAGGDGRPARAGRAAGRRRRRGAAADAGARPHAAVPGGATKPEVVVDYAHTPDALDKVLQALRPLARRAAAGCGACSAAAATATPPSAR